MHLEGLRLGDFSLGAELGRGGMGAVHRARAEVDGPAGPRGSALAVKVFHAHLAEQPQAYERFKREAEVGMRIRHPNVVQTFALGSQDVDGTPVHYIAMELIEGQTLAGLLQELGTVPETLRAQIADQVLAALDAVHRAGIVHRDVKPENIVITPDYRVLLMDLGIARLRERGHTLTEVGSFVGSLAYAAPEQFMGEDDLGPAADLYAFGLVLFELATGRGPFTLTDLPALVTAKVQGALPSPHTLNPDVDAFWSEVILTAARARPEERFASAEAMRSVLREGEASAWWRERRAHVASAAVEPALRRLRVEREAPLVGRKQALDALVAALRLARKEGRVLLVTGASGVGKSRLIVELLERVGSDGDVRFAAGRCVGSGGRSHQPFVEALGDLLLPAGIAPSERRAALERRLRALLSDTPGVVAPFAEFLLGGVHAALENALPKDALLAATARVVERLAAEHPLVLVIEDLHVAGAETVELFQYLARCVPGHRVLLLGALCEDDLEDGAPAQALVGAGVQGTPERLALGPLDESAVEDLVRSVVHVERTVRSLARPLHDRGDGNPFLVLEMLGLLRTEGVLVAHPEGLVLARPLEGLAVPASLREVVGLRLGRLDEEARETLEAAAVLGFEFEAPLLAAVLGQNRISLLKRLAVLERRNRLVVGFGKSSFRFASRRLFETVYRGINGPLRSEYHALVADTLREGLGEGGLAAADPATSYELLRHLLEAERALEALPVLERALEYVAARFHASFAAPFLERVAAAFERATPAARVSIAMRLWSAYERLGSRSDQLRVLDMASTLATRVDDAALRSRIHVHRAGSFWYAGDYAQADTEARAGLELARAAGDRRLEATSLHTLGAVAFRRGEPEVAATELREALRIRRETGDRRGEASTLQALALVMPGTGHEADVLPTMEQALAIWREVGERRGESAVLMNIGTRLVDLARFDEGMPYLERAIAGHRETGALPSEALALANLGHAYEVVGRFDAARDAWRRALGLFVDLGDPHGEAAVRTMLGTALGAEGHHTEAREQLESAVALAWKRGAKAKVSAAHRELGSLLHRMGQKDEGWEHLERALTLEREARNVSSRMATLGAMGYAALADGRPERAAGYLAEALPDARRSTGAAAGLILARLARARRALGQDAEAQELAKEALARLEGSTHVSPDLGPEMYGSLAQVVDDDAVREDLLQRARRLVEQRAGHIADDAAREAFLRRTWANLQLAPP
jgi:tetratricopeptide (TPR) repeat protein